jgi:hypothetical protein
MAREPVRDPLADHLLTPQNAAMFVIDYQRSQFAGVRSIDRDLLLENIDYPVVDALGGTSEEAHGAGLERVARAGGQPISWVALASELQRDWAREETVADVVEIVLTERLLQA